MGVQLRPSWIFQLYLNPIVEDIHESGQQKRDCKWYYYSPSTVSVTSHWASPVSQVYVPESSGTRLWIRSWWSAPLFLKSYLRPGWMAMLFLVQVTVALGSEMVQARVTVSPSNPRVLCGFSNISTANIGNQNNSSNCMQSFALQFTYNPHINNFSSLKNIDAITNLTAQWIMMWQFFKIYNFKFAKMLTNKLSNKTLFIIIFNKLNHLFNLVAIFVLAF